MNSEKVKEIKKALECIVNANAPKIELNYYGNLHADILTLINESEKENDELKVDLKNSIDMQKQMLDSFKTATKEVEENLIREIPNLLKQFAEMLKEKVHKRDYVQGYAEIGLCEEIDETLEEFIRG